MDYSLDHCGSWVDGDSRSLSKILMRVSYDTHNDVYFVDREEEESFREWLMYTFDREHDRMSIFRDADGYETLEPEEFFDKYDIVVSEVEIDL